MINQFVTAEWTQSIQKVIKEVVNDPTTYRGSKYLPSITQPTSEIFVDIVEATGGLTNEHLPGTNPKIIQSFGTRTDVFSPAYYKEEILYNESQILNLRKLGDNGRNARGIQEYIELSLDQLNRRIEARIEKQRWDALFNGGWSFMDKTISFNVPSGNRALPVGAVWSLDGVSANNSANPVADLRYWIMSGYAPFRKYQISKLVMNGNTARWILENENTRQYLTSYGANAKMSGYDVNTVLNFLIPGVPEVDVYNGWYQTETVGAENQIVVSDAIQFIPDGYIFFEVSNLPGNDKIGDFVQTIQLADGTIETPGVGKFVLVEDCTRPGSRGGPANPFISLLGGVYGGTRLSRPFDLLTAKVIS